MVTKLLVGAVFLSLTACQLWANEPLFDVKEEEHEAAVFFLGEADMNTLKGILNQWEFLLKGMVAYAGSDKYLNDQYLSGCDPAALTINHINSVGVLGEQSIKNIFPEYKGYLEKGLLVRTINTRHPCFLNDKSKSVNWFFIFDEEYVILDTAYMLSH